jgi:hypothetical protein
MICGRSVSASGGAHRTGGGGDQCGLTGDDCASNGDSIWTDGSWLRYWSGLVLLELILDTPLYKIFRTPPADRSNADKLRRLVQKATVRDAALGQVAAKALRRDPAKRLTAAGACALLDESTGKGIKPKPKVKPKVKPKPKPKRKEPKKAEPKPPVKKPKGKDKKADAAGDVKKPKAKAKKPQGAKGKGGKEGGGRVQPGKGATAAKKKGG